MAVGIYGNKTLASVDFNDLDILYSFAQDRNSLPTQLVPLFNSVTSNEFKNIIGSSGIYSLRLPASVFNQLGFYTVLIQPKQFITTLQSCSYVISSTDQELSISKRGVV